jgi:hypothetical protein
MTIWREVYPIGRSFGLIRGAPDVVCTLVYKELQRSLGALGDEVAYVGSIQGPAQALASLDPVAFPVEDRYLILECPNNWSLYLDNSALFDASPPRLADIARVQGADTIHVCSTIPGAGDENPLQQIAIFRAGLGLVRSVSNSCYRGEWRVATEGAPYPFEDAAAYEAPATEASFTREHLRSFLAQLGVQVSWDDLLSLYEDAAGYILERRAGERANVRQIHKPLTEFRRRPDLDARLG